MYVVLPDILKSFIYGSKNITVGGWKVTVWTSDGMSFNSRQAKTFIFPRKPPEDSPKPTQLHFKWVPQIFPGSERGRLANSFTLSIGNLNKKRHYTFTPLHAFMACTRTVLTFLLLCDFHFYSNYILTYVRSWAHFFFFLKRPIHSQLNWAILLCDVIPDIKTE